jgi:hypothetical protein
VIGDEKKEKEAEVFYTNLEKAIAIAIVCPH